MKFVGGIALPDYDEHFATQMIFGTYQIDKLNAAVALCGRRSLAVDVGAHVGLWSRELAKRFARVIAYEPLPEHIECFKTNVRAFPNVILNSCALGNKAGKVRLATEGENSGRVHVDTEGVSADVRRLDDETLSKVDLLKIDVEGYELFVVQGAEKMIRADRPVIIVEQKPNNAERYGVGRKDALNLLKRWGYKMARKMSGDYILTC